MGADTSYIFFSILRSILHGKPMSDADKILVTDDSMIDVIKMASKHDLKHLFSLGILNHDLADDEIKPQIQQTIFRAAYRYEKQNYVLQQICETLEKAEIAFVPLKGSVLRKFYPEPWMRTCCDIDVLVQEKDLQTAISCLTENLNYTGHEKNSHDVSMFSPGGIHVELHYDLVEEGLAKASSGILSKIWDVVETKKGYHFWCEMPDEYFYFYHIAHMAKHFEGGGCGIRPFMDLWILEHMDEVDHAKRDTLLLKGNLLKFADAVRKLSRVWFENEEYDIVSKQMEDYILRGGVYGSNENRIALQQQMKGGKIKYALSKIFIPYNVIKFHYPVLQNHRWLTPFMEVRRWFKLVFCGHAQRTIAELQYSQNLPAEEADATRVFLKNIGL